MASTAMRVRHWKFYRAAALTSTAVPPEMSCLALLGWGWLPQYLA